jgi:Tol biopolymer transport system component
LVKRAATWALACAALSAGCGGGGPLPRDLTGTLVFVSDRDGRDALYLRRLPGGADFQLTHLTEPVGEPALSPNGRQVAFTMGGRIGLLTVETHEVSFVTLGKDWQDASPCWRADGKALVVSSRRQDGSSADLHLLMLGSPAGADIRRPLTRTDHQDELSPSCSPDGASVAFVRGDNAYRLVLADDSIKRLTGGFRLVRVARFLPSGRLLCLWSQGKQFGVDVMDADGHNRETLSQGSAFYRTVAPSPDGKYLAATLTYEANALRFQQREEVRLLDAKGLPLGTLAESWRTATHSAHWGR